MNNNNVMGVNAQIVPEWRNFKIPIIEKVETISNNVMGIVKQELPWNAYSSVPSAKNSFSMVSPLSVNEEVKPIIIDPMPDVTMHTVRPPPSIGATAGGNSNKRKVPDAGYVVSQHVRSMDRLPTDLTKLFLPLFCELCGIHSNSPISARAHYTSVGHDKKIKVWLLKRDQEMGEPDTKKAKTQDTASTALHCTICDIPLSSASMANQHYSGRKHISAAKGFANQSSSAGSSGADNVDSNPRALSASLAPIVQPNEDVFCAICNISVSAKAEMINHLKGIRHAKRLRAAGIAPYTPNADTDTIMQCVRSSIIELLPTIKQMQRDTSINRTPSGHFYCKTCNVTLDTEVLFMQHLDSKRHRKQNK